MLIDGRRTEFPPAELRVRQRGDDLALLLYSNDPKNAIDDRYTGNSFYFDMLIESTDASDLPTARWTFKATNSERLDTVSGIFLQGRKFHLQPSDVQIEFDQPADGNDSHVTAMVSGMFLMFDPADETLPPRLIAVKVQLPAELILKK